MVHRELWAFFPNNTMFGCSPVLCSLNAVFIPMFRLHVSRSRMRLSMNEGLQNQGFQSKSGTVYKPPAIKSCLDGFPKLGGTFWGGPHNEDYSISCIYWGPLFGESHTSWHTTMGMLYFRGEDFNVSRVGYNISGLKLRTLPHGP